MLRWNAEGLPRNQLIWALSRPDIVGRFRRINSCMLCMARDVNEAALCEVCYGMLEGDELNAAVDYMAGVRP